MGVRWFSWAFHLGCYGSFMGFHGFHWLYLTWEFMAVPWAATCSRWLSLQFHGLSDGLSWQFHGLACHPWVISWAISWAFMGIHDNSFMDVHWLHELSHGLPCRFQRLPSWASMGCHGRSWVCATFTSFHGRPNELLWKGRRLSWGGWSKTTSLRVQQNLPIYAAAQTCNERRFLQLVCWTCPLCFSSVLSPTTSRGGLHCPHHSDGRSQPGLVSPCYTIYHTQMRVVAALEVGPLSALRGTCFDARWILSFASSATVPACPDISRGGPARRPARVFVRPASAKKDAKLSRFLSCIPAYYCHFRI